MFTPNSNPAGLGDHNVSLYISLGFLGPLAAIALIVICRNSGWRRHHVFGRRIMATNFWDGIRTLPTGTHVAEEEHERRPELWETIVHQSGDKISGCIGEKVILFGDEIP